MPGEQKDGYPNTYESYNRSHRRRSQRTDPGALFTSRMNQSLYAMNDAIISYNKAMTSVDHRAGRIIFEADPIFDRLMVTHKMFGEMLHRGQYQNTKHGFIDPTLLNSKDEFDIFSTKIRGVSLADIEAMQYPLSNDDIGIINRFLRVFKFTKFNLNHKLIRESAIGFAAQKYAKPELKAVSPSLKHLHQNLSDYFDYYVDQLLNYDQSVEDETQLVESLVWTGYWLNLGLGVYVPARLGITPSSTVKIFEQRRVNANDPWTAYVWGNVVRAVHQASRYAYRPVAFEAEMLPYISYDQASDRRAAKMLADRYRGVSGGEAVNQTTQLPGLLELVNATRREIYRRVNAKESLQATLPEGVGIRNVRLWSQNPEVLILLMDLPEADAKLTLELDAGDYMYGLPPRLARDFPHIREVILKDILQAYEEKLKSLLPAYPVKVIEPRPSAIFPTVEDLRVKRAYQPPVEKPDKVEAPKRPKFAMAILVGSQIPPVAREKVAPKHFVGYSRAEVVGFFGKKVPPQKHIDQIMTTIRKFERDGVFRETLTDKDGNVWKVLDSGWYRVALLSEGRSRYTCKFVGNHADTYRYILPYQHDAGRG